MELTGSVDCIISSPPFQASDSRGGTKMPDGYFSKVGGIRTSDDFSDFSVGNLSSMKQGEAPMSGKKLSGIEVDCWTGCYEDNWKGIITPESFAHPAKFALGLIKKILTHLRETGRLKKGQLIVDPFGGIGSGGIIAASRGYRWAGVELEPPFVVLAASNFALHRRKWDKDLQPRIFQGDSRKLSTLLQEAGVIVSSPPFEQGTHSDNDFQAPHDSRKRMVKGKGYGDCPGNLGNLRSGNVDSVISSPPFMENNVNIGSVGDTPGKRQQIHNSVSRNKSYGDCPGNLGNLRSGNVDSVISSPPSIGAVPGKHEEKARDTKEGLRSRGRKRLKGVAKGKDLALGKSSRFGGCGDSEGNLSNMEEGKGYPNSNGQEQGDTFWASARDIVLQCFQILKPGGTACWVCKDFIRNKTRVPFSDDWLRLCLACGFRLVCRHRAMLVKSHTIPTLFGDEVKRKEKKSFFRRLHESKMAKGDLRRIDWEDVICVEKPLDSA